MGRGRKADLVLRLLRRHLATLPAGAEERIAGLPIAALETLGEALLDFAGSADLADWLDRHARSALRGPKTGPGTSPSPSRPR